MGMFQKIISFFGDFLMPRKNAESYILRSETRDILSRLPRNMKVLPEKMFASVLYQHPISRALLSLLKYENKGKAFDIATDLLAETILGELEESLSREMFLLVPIPMSTKERRERGFNPAEKLAELLARRKGFLGFLRYAPILKKIRETQRQTELRRRERLINIRGAFAVKENSDVRGKKVILLDDIMTTGATMNEARRVLLESGAQECICFAVAY